MKLLLVANVAKEHVLKFHIPTIKALKRHGWIVDVACAGEESIPSCDQQFHTGWKRSPFSAATFKGIKELTSIIANGKYDIIYAHTPVGGMVSRLAARKYRRNGLKTIYVAHGFHFFKGAPLVNWLVYFPVEWLLAHFTDAVFTVNRQDYQLAKSLFPSKCRIIQVPEVGINTQRLHLHKDRDVVRKEYREQLGIQQDAFVMIYVAELIPNKNQKMLLEMLAEVKLEIPNAYLLLPGPDHYEGMIQKQIEEMRLQDSVQCLGWRNDIGELMAAADVCTASSIREGFGINLAEAMYCGLPVIATRNRGHEMIIEDGVNGFLVPIDDSPKMAQRVIQLYRDNALREKFSHMDAVQYDAELIAEQLVAEIQQVYEW